MRVLYSFPDTLGRAGHRHRRARAGHAASRERASRCTWCATRLAADPGVPHTLTMTVAGRRVRQVSLRRDRAGSLRAYAWHDRVVAALLRRRTGFDVVHCWPQATSGPRDARRARRHPGAAPGAEHPHRATRSRRWRRPRASSACRCASATSTGTRVELVTREEREYEAVDALLVPVGRTWPRTFRERGVPRSACAVHRFGYDLERFRAGRRPPADRPFTVLFVARGEAAKGLHHGLRAWQRLRRRCCTGRLVLCGADRRRLPRASPTAAGAPERRGARLRLPTARRSCARRRPAAAQP